MFSASASPELFGGRRSRREAHGSKTRAERGLAFPGPSAPQGDALGVLRLGFGASSWRHPGSHVFLILSPMIDLKLVPTLKNLRQSEQKRRTSGQEGVRRKGSSAAGSPALAASAAGSPAFAGTTTLESVFLKAQ